MKRLLLTAAALCLAAAAARAQQGGRVDLSSLDHLAPLAAKSQVREEQTPGGKGLVSVREFEFREAGAYQASVLAAVREQLRAPGWSRMVKLEDREEPGQEETVEVYVYTNKAGGRVQGGMLIINSEPRELTVVNIAGEGDARKLMEQIRRSQGKQKPKP